MIHEFAVDPQVMSSWQTFRYLNDHFGVSHGRLISRFPKEWKRMVYAACANCSDMEKKRVEEGLRGIESKLISAGRSYQRQSSWIGNARRSHNDHPFRAILTTETNADGGQFLDADTVDSSSPNWRVDREGIVERKAKDLAASANLILEHSAEICFIDQYFSCSERHGRPLTEFLKLCFSGRPIRRLEYHLNGDGDPGWFRGKLESQRRWLHLPEGASMSFIRWRQIDGGEKLHPRYILTDLGGLRFEHGLDEGEDGEKTDVSLLDGVTYLHRWQQFQPGAGAFEFVDAWIVTHDSVTRAEPDGDGYRRITDG